MHHNISYIIHVVNLLSVLQQRAGGKKSEYIREMRELLGPIAVSTHGETTIRMRPDQFALASYLMDNIGAKFITVKRIDNIHVDIQVNKPKHDITERNLGTWRDQCSFVEPIRHWTDEQNNTMINVLNDIDQLNKAMSNMVDTDKVVVQGVTFRTVDMIPMFAERLERAQAFLTTACDLIFRKGKKEEVQRYTSI